MKDKLSINIKIGNRGYPLVVDRDDEEKYRNAAKLLNESVLKYKGLYAEKDEQDILAMAAFHHVLKLLEVQKKAEGTLLNNEIKNLTDDISDFLEERVAKQS